MDIFEPRHEPARTLYRIFQEKAKERPQHPNLSWILLEREAMWRTARDCAQQLGLRVVTMQEVEDAESAASGHTDYGAKWAYGIVEAMKKEILDNIT